MHICYIDEAGCTGVLPAADSQIQPVFVLGALFVDDRRIKPMTAALLDLKRKFFPNALSQESLRHDWMAVEIKGSDLRKKSRSGRNARRFAHMVIGRALSILEDNEVKLVGRVYVKPVAGDFKGAAVYTSSVQGTCASFQEFLVSAGSTGLVIADSRNKPANSNVSHSVFTQRHSAGGDPYSRLIEVPTFGHSDNHAGLQFSDLVCSSLLFPIAAQACCSARMIDQTHLSEHYLELREQFGTRLKHLQYRYQDHAGRWRGGLTLVDPAGKRGARVLFEGEAE